MTAAAPALLMKVEALNLTDIDDVDGPPWPGGEVDDEDLVFYWGAARRTYWIAATVGRSTAPGDTPSNTWIPAKIAAPLEYGASLFAGVDPLQPGASSVGVLELIDPDGELDWLADLAWDGATITLLRGDPSAAVSTYAAAAVLTGAGLEYDGELKRIMVRDLAWQLDQAALHDTRYAGTGGYEGGPELANVVRPVCWGRVFNIPLRRLNDQDLIFEASCVALQAWHAVREGGTAFVPSGLDYASFDALKAALDAAAVPAGQYATCLAKGLAGLGSLDADPKTLTADVTGYAATMTRGAIAWQVVTALGALKLTAAEIDAGSFAALDAAQPAACGFWFGEEISKAQALNEVLKGCLGDWTFGLDGRLSVGLTDEVPEDVDFTVSLPQADVAQGDYQALGEPEMLASEPPVQAVYLGWSYNYTEQPQSDLHGSVSPSDVTIYGMDSRKAAAVDEAMALARPTAPKVTIANAGFVYEADAQLEADRQLSVRSKRRERWRQRIAASYVAPLRQVFGVRGWPDRYRFGAERRMRCVGVSASQAVEDELVIEGYC